jgi:hypothetical protein
MIIACVVLLHFTGGAILGEGVQRLAAAPAPGKTPVAPGGEDGHPLARRVREQVPPEADVRGLLKQRDGEGSRSERAVVFRVTHTPDGGSVTRYEAAAPPHEIVVVRQTPSGARSVESGMDETSLKPVEPGGWFRPFAASDFVVLDLALGFLDWPEQRIVAKELRRGRACTVLESRSPASDGADAGGYARVRSWVDNETGGILHADAYDSAGRHVKEFSLRSFKKVDGRWQLREMEMIDLRRDSRTRWEFDLSVPAGE